MQQTTREPSGWAIGWAMFAAIVMMMSGFFEIISGIVAIANDDFYVVTREWVFDFDTTAWGWIHLILGIVLVLVGAGIATGNLAARIVGVFVAAVSAIVSFAFLPYYPVWAVVVIAVDVAVIWALTAHGRDVELR